MRRGTVPSRLPFGGGPWVRTYRGEEVRKVVSLKQWLSAVIKTFEEV